MASLEKPPGRASNAENIMTGDIKAKNLYLRDIFSHFDQL